MTPAGERGPARPRIEHIAIWTTDVEQMRSFYGRYFGAVANDRYVSVNRRGFSSYFLTFPGGGSRLELMQVPDVGPAASQPAVGYAHIAVTVASRADVLSLTARMERDGVRVISAPRQTGDGYFESVIADPDGNQVEVVADASPAAAPAAAPLGYRGDDP